MVEKFARVADAGSCQRIIHGSCRLIRSFRGWNASIQPVCQQTTFMITQPSRSAVRGVDQMVPRAKSACLNGSQHHSHRRAHFTCQTMPFAAPTRLHSTPEQPTSTVWHSPSTQHWAQRVSLWHFQNSPAKTDEPPVPTSRVSSGWGERISGHVVAIGNGSRIHSRRGFRDSRRTLSHDFSRDQAAPSQAAIFLISVVSPQENVCSRCSPFSGVAAAGCPI